MFREVVESEAVALYLFLPYPSAPIIPTLGAVTEPLRDGCPFCGAGILSRRRTMLPADRHLPRAPILLEDYMVKDMKYGSVVVDLAAAGGGNCALTKPGEACAARARDRCRDLDPSLQGYNMAR